MACLSSSLTATALLVEGLAAPLCLILPVRCRHWCALTLVGLHFGLFMSLRLPQWQCLAMLTQVVWVPSHVWDWLDGSAKVKQNQALRRDKYKKNDGDSTSTSTSMAGTVSTQSSRIVVRHAANHSPRWSRAIQLFALVYALYNFAGERGWIRKHDNGDIGEALRLSQYWVMYGSVAETAHTTLLTGILQSNNNADFNTNERRIDLLEYIRTGGGPVQPALSPDIVPLDMSRRYPSARWERAVQTWASQSFDDVAIGRGRQLCRALCILIQRDDRAKPWNSQLEAIELRVQHSHILPPGSVGRYAEKRTIPDTVTTVQCGVSKSTTASAGVGLV